VSEIWERVKLPKFTTHTLSVKRGTYTGYFYAGFLIWSVGHITFIIQKGFAKQIELNDRANDFKALDTNSKASTSKYEIKDFESKLTLATLICTLFYFFSYYFHKFFNT